jgi:hypothetical protein
MSALKDLRELVNVSRLTYREGDSDTEQPDFRFDPKSIPVISKKDLPPPLLKKKPLLFDSSLLSPIKSRTVPNEKSSATSGKSRDAYVLSSVVDNPTSSVIVKSRDSLLDRRSIPSSVQFNNIKKSLPPLNTSLALNLTLGDSDELSAENDEASSMDRTIGPVRDEAENKSDRESANSESFIKDLKMMLNFFEFHAKSKNQTSSLKFLTH